MEFDKIFQRYKRFMKENGVYARMKSIYLSKCSTHGKRSFAELKELLSLHIEPFSWVQGAGVFCTWSSTKEGELFWWLICIRWQVVCIKESVFINSACKKSFIESLNGSLNAIVDFYKDSISKENKLELSKYKKEIKIIYKKKYE